MRAKGLRGFLKDEQGQVLPLAAVMLVAVLSAVALITDVGHATYSQRELQAATDASALAGAGELRSATTISQVTAEATLFSAVSGNKNARSNLPNVSMAAGYPMVKCLVTLENEGMACVGDVPYNAVQVKETSVVPMTFAGVFGHPTVMVGASATASVRGGSPTPYNVAVIVDTTLSMLDYDSDCGQTQMTCALNGFQVLLQALSPCARSIKTCVTTNGVSSSPVDQVSLWTFPNVTIGTAPQDYECTTAVPSSYTYDAAVNAYIVMPPSNAYSDIPTAMAYSLPLVGAYGYSPSGSSTATYQVTPYLSDYKVSSNTKALNSSSNLVKAAGGATGCGGMSPSNFDGVYGTYYAGVLYAAQSSLVAQQAANPGTQNAMILLSDGDATAGTINGSPSCCNGSYQVFGTGATSLGVYPSWVGMCGQAILAAKAAALAGTQVYSVAYGSEPTGCVSDQKAGTYPNVSPCDTMADIASAPQYFYSDYKQSGSGSTCYASQPVTSLSAIFAAIGAAMSTARLIPDSTT